MGKVIEATERFKEHRFSLRTTKRTILDRFIDSYSYNHTGWVAQKETPTSWWLHQDPLTAQEINYLNDEMYDDDSDPVAS